MTHEMMQFTKATEIDVPDLPDPPENNQPDFCENCFQWGRYGTICYNCLPDKPPPRTNKERRFKNFHDQLTQLYKATSEISWVPMFEPDDADRIEELFYVFNSHYKSNYLPFKYLIAKMADLLKIDHQIKVDETPRDIKLWAKFIALKPLDIIREKKEYNENMEKQYR